MENNIGRHLQHQRTDNVEYTEIPFEKIPSVAEIRTLDEVPEIGRGTDVRELPKYILVGGSYYVLVGMRPDAETLLDGEVAVSMKKGFESIFIRNSDGEIVEFRPVGSEADSVVKLVVENPELECVDGECVWHIAHVSLKSKGIDPENASVTVRERESGRIVVADVRFGVWDMSSGEECVGVYFDSNADIPEGSYSATII